jgi:NADPH:quinone reductase-like Zn-dependent oxidoreductase
MKAIFLVKKGAPEKAFEFREVNILQPGENQILIKVEGFGLNFADIVAREGMYKDAPPIPCVIGYDVVGRIESFGNNVNGFTKGDRVAALTRFGGYAEYAVTDSRAAIKIPDSLNIAEGTALCTQYATAYYCAVMAANLREGEKVVIHAASGGVGSALLQYAKHKRCEIYATTSSDSKMSLLKEVGATYVINSSKGNFYDAIRKHSPHGVDVIFDALGGKFVKQGIKLLNSGGRIVCYGASQMTGTSLWGRIKAGLQFGIYHPAQLMMPSKSLLGVNMLQIADKRPELLQLCLQQVMKLYTDGVFKPAEGKIFSASEIATAHRYLQEKKAIGKVALIWN